MAPVRMPWRTALLAALLALAIVLVSAGPARAYENGHLPGSALSQADTGFRCSDDGDQLASDAAAGYNTAALAAGKPLPSNGCESLYRSYDEQVQLRSYWCGQGNCGNAAVPGTSNHGLGLAADVQQWVRAYFDSTHGAYGFDKSCSDAPQEWWHLKFCAPFHRPNPGTSLKYPLLRKGSGGPGQAAYVKRVQKHLRIWGYRQVSTDGDFGKVTAHAVKAFQGDHHLHPDGIVGKATWHRLLKSPANNGGQGGHAPPPPPIKHGDHKHHPGKHADHKLPTKTIRGIDVSSFQGDVSWGKVRKAGYRFAIAKATEGGDYVDPWFTDNRMRSIEEAHLVPGVYHFLRPQPGRAAATEASFFTRAILAAGYGKGWLPPVIDIETTQLAPKATCHYLRSAATRIERNVGARPIIYTYPSFVAEHLAGCSWMAHYRLWIADYSSGPPTVPAPWTKYLMHQYTGTGSAPGVAGDVDISRMPGGLRKLAHIRVGALPKRLTQKKKARALAPRAVPQPVTEAAGFALAAGKRGPHSEAPSNHAPQG